MYLYLKMNVYNILVCFISYIYFSIQILNLKTDLKISSKLLLLEIISSTNESVY